MHLASKYRQRCSPRAAIARHFSFDDVDGCDTRVEGRPDVPAKQLEQKLYSKTTSYFASSKALLENDQLIDDGISAIDLRVAAHDRYQEGRSAVATRPSATPFPVDIHPGTIGAY
jgi:hypothetical protein